MAPVAPASTTIASLPVSARVHEADGEQRGARLFDAAGERPRPRPLHEAVAEDVQPEKGRELSDERHRADRGKKAVLAGKAADGTSHEEEAPPHDPPHQERQGLEPRASTREHERGDQAHRGEHHDEQAENEADPDHGPCFLHDQVGERQGCRGALAGRRRPFQLGRPGLASATSPLSGSSSGLGPLPPRRGRTRNGARRSTQLRFSRPARRTRRAPRCGCARSRRR